MSSIFKKGSEIMCIECNKHICPCTCPNCELYDYSDDNDNYEFELQDNSVCVCCNESLERDQLFAYIEDDKYCLDCIKDFDIDDILRIMNIKSIVELVSELGFVFDKN